MIYRIFRDDKPEHLLTELTDAPALPQSIGDTLPVTLDDEEKHLTITKGPVPNMDKNRLVLDYWVRVPS